MTSVTVGVVAFALGMLATRAQPYMCVHKWGKWYPVRGLTIAIHDEFGGRTTKSYNRFERECTKCGIITTKKKRTT